MKLNINLASQPYEDSGDFYRQWLPLLLILGALALALGGKATASFISARRIDRQIADRQAHIETLRKERMAAEHTLAEPQNSGTRDRAQFLNQVFSRKAFSWTQVLMDLEGLMPSGVQVASIKPELDPQQRLQFALVVLSDRRDAVIELIRRMEDSPRFLKPQLRSETRRDEQGVGARTAAEIVAQYVPDVRRAEAPKPVLPKPSTSSAVR